MFINVIFHLLTVAAVTSARGNKLGVSCKAKALTLSEQLA